MKLDKLMKDLKSWKTTALGFIGGLMMILPQIQAILDDDPETVFVKSIFMTGLAMMGFGIAARDGDKTSKELDLTKGEQNENSNNSVVPADD